MMNNQSNKFSDREQYNVTKELFDVAIVYNNVF